MKSIILAAGKGTRVRPLTYHVPKPMIPILHKPVMELLVELLARHGVRQILVNTSYLPGAIENYFRDGSRFGVEMAYSFEGRMSDGLLLDEPLGSAGALRKIQDQSGFFDQTFLALCGDAIVDLDLTRLAAFHRQRRALATIALLRVPVEEVSSYGVVVCDQDGRVTEFQEKPSVEQARSTLVNTGIYIFEPSILDWIPAGRPYDIGSELFPSLVAAGAPLYAAEIPFRWYDIGRLPDYLKVVKTALQGDVPELKMPGTEVAKGIWTGLNVRLDLAATRVVPPVYIGGSAIVEPGATIVGPSAIGPGCIVEHGAHIEGSVVLEYTRVGSGAMLKDMLVCGGYCVDAYGGVIELVRSDIGFLLADSRSGKAPMTADQEALLQMIADTEASFGWGGLRPGAAH